MLLAELRRRVEQLHVLIVGDVMLDEYWFGDVHRISPEAPVPVVRVLRSDERPGGAANVAHNVAAFGAKATLLSVVGNDETATRLKCVLESRGIAHMLQVDDGIRTTLKLRIIGQQQQMLRIDFEGAPSDNSLDAKLGEFEQMLPAADVVIFSDYGKGALSRIGAMITAARNAGKLAIVDPKGHDYSGYAGADLITPNRGELTDVVGPWSDDAEMATKAEELRKRLHLKALLLTMSERGMRLFRDGSSFSRTARTREVFDVSGAGDTVVAAVGVLRGIGASWEEAVDFANVAAGIVVSRLGASAATLDEVIEQLGRENHEL